MSIEDEMKKVQGEISNEDFQKVKYVLQEAQIEGMLDAYRNLYAQVEHGEISTFLGLMKKKDLLAWLDFECEVLCK